jgi:4-amino-4-deoxy-L-arabinose transferase-like glycosyltransferase
MKAMKHTPPLIAVAAGIMLGLLPSRASLVALLPWAIVLLCPLMMLFMMRGMGHDGALPRPQRPGRSPHPANQARGRGC